MTRVVCVSPEQLPANLQPEVDYFTVYRSAGNARVDAFRQFR